MILQKENQILRGNAEKVANIKSAEVKALIVKMAKAMFAEPDGIGIAAPQIGVSLRIFLVAKEAAIKNAAELHEKIGDKNKKRNTEYLVFINPALKKSASKKIKDVEGCLSVRGIYGEVPRAEKITIEYLDESEKKHQRGASGLFARVIQHELDHLDGVLFIDKARNLKTYNLKRDS
ncbi:peptide deformylase [Candidatus Giovannonibacteria bacterium RIFCSPHIGHO2_01_FULL_45_24]|uniref:Peptide deformylase n=1 Tax=Candidatus Giovannonibacteria bacterium RIFCSPLOWO2_01_FULL_46_32 TaxID=1798353 RepID=A0A1F5XH89_9BACT|nr:MAG: peptide deformylase [Candidatus Giovannonibacteria bacterium RIFCSPHIGHO2_01_FULL_45_24]OGF86851.1 MAG: peptide deformylase [Candidatus Giovannonibacteria bacterium RIFCSPLOWO2_01_FULL_46_32]